MPKRRPRKPKKAAYQPPRLERLGSLREVTLKSGSKADNRPHPRKP